LKTASASRAKTAEIAGTTTTTGCATAKTRPASPCATSTATPLGGTDCDDGNDEIDDDADEIRDYYDNDFDAAVNDDDDDVVGAPLWYADRDGDGYGDPG